MFDHSGPQIIPQEATNLLSWTGQKITCFSVVLEFLKTKSEGLYLKGEFELNKMQKNALNKLRQAFASNNHIKKLMFEYFAVHDILVAQVFKSAFANEETTCIEFWRCTATDPKLMEIMCEGLLERSTMFQLVLSNECSLEVVKPVLEASYLKCFSLSINNINCETLRGPIKKNFMMGNLYYVGLTYLKGMKEILCLEIARCLPTLPCLIRFNLEGTPFPTSALKRLHGSLRLILESQHSTLDLSLGTTKMDERLTYCYFKLLSTDLICDVELNVGEDAFTPALVKSISSTVASTSNLKRLSTENRFRSPTGFKEFKLQDENDVFRSPFRIV